MKIFPLTKNWLFHLENEAYIRTGDESMRDYYADFNVCKNDYPNGGFPSRLFPHSNWRQVELPHDYALELPFDTECFSAQGHKPVNNTVRSSEKPTMHAGARVFPVAWYRKEFFISEDGDYVADAPAVFGDRMAKEPGNRRYLLEFEGVFRDCIVWVNGIYIDRHTSGYTGFTYDITDQILYGETNTVAVRVDCSQYEGWWYEGAGIYRPVHLMIAEPVYALPEDVLITPDVSGDVALSAQLHNFGDDSGCEAEFIIQKDGKSLCAARQTVQLMPGDNTVTAGLHVDAPRLWSPRQPELYTLVLRLNGKQEQAIPFGFKKVEFDPQRGMFLNGKPLKIQGVCLHQDLFGVGIAVPRELAFFKIRTMKEMGANAIRSAHNPPSRDILDACDRLGMLLMDETRMFGSSPEALRQLESLVKRDRNHVSVFLWSVGNEERLQDTVLGGKQARTACKRIKQLCPGAITTYAHNGGCTPEGVNEVVDVLGVNYIRIGGDTQTAPDRYHAAHPEKPIYSSEEMSSLTMRGIYKNDPENHRLDAYGENCFYWCTTPEGFFRYYTQRDFYCGGFAWTGFDYRGEPDPFIRTNQISNFGIVDLCGFPKDSYYYYKAWWTEEPVLHLLPHWNHTPGEEIRVVAYTNCEEVSLYLNGELLSKVYPEKYVSPQWQVPFQPGELKAVGIRGGKTCTCVRRTQQMGGIALHAQKEGRFWFVDGESVDTEGEHYPLGDQLLRFAVRNGRILGAGNGDPTSFEREEFRMAEEQCRQIPVTAVEQPPRDSICRPECRVVYEAPAEPFYDKFRRVWEESVWTNEGEKREEDRYVYSASFTGLPGDSFVELTGLPGNRNVLRRGELWLNGEKAAEFTGLLAGPVRPFRFYVPIREGENTLQLRFAVTGGHTFAIGKVLVGGQVLPAAERSLFSGRLRLLVEAEENCTVTAQSADGLYSATLRIQ